jgi:hypothetical protein
MRRFSVRGREWERRCEEWWGEGEGSEKCEVRMAGSEVGFWGDKRRDSASTLGFESVLVWFTWGEGPMVGGLRAGQGVCL